MRKYILFVMIILASCKTSKDQDFISKFNPVYLNEGDNATYPTKGSQVTVHYTGTFKDGKKFDSSLDRNDPFVFQLGVGQVIQCWDMVVSHLSKGEKIQVTCPSELAYGKRGAGGIIPGDTDLNFVIELLNWK